MVKLKGKIIHKEKGRLDNDKRAQEAEVTAIAKAIMHMKINNQKKIVF